MGQQNGSNPSSQSRNHCLIASLCSALMLITLRKKRSMLGVLVQPALISFFFFPAESVLSPVTNLKLSSEFNFSNHTTHVQTHVVGEQIH